MKLLNLLLLLLPLITCAQAPVPPESLTPSCANCERYCENKSWLPDAYVHNADCACLFTPDTPTANRIRFILQQRLETTPQPIKELAAGMKTQRLAGNISKRKYNRFVKRVLTPLIYADHAAAYAMAGCKGDPAPYRAWKFVTTKKVRNCKLVWWSIRWMGGSCTGCTGRW